MMACNTRLNTHFALIPISQIQVLLQTKNYAAKIFAFSATGPNVFATVRVPALQAMLPLLMKNDPIYILAIPQ